MPADPRRPQNQGWKGPAKPTEGRHRRDWHQDQGTTVERRPWSRSTKITLLLCSFLVLLVALGVLVWYVRPTDSADLVLVGAGYEENLAIPANVYGWEGAKALQGLGESGARLGPLTRLLGGNTLRVVNQLQPLKKADDLNEALSTLSGRKTLLLFVSLQGAASPSGPYLLGDSPQGQKAVRLSVTDLLDQLKKEAGGRNRVLVLDITEMAESWPLGVMGNDFADQLRERLGETIRQDPKLVVICSCDQGQRSWGSYRWGQSVFAHYFLEGLRGKDKAANAGVITARSLYEYTRDKVQRWAQANRNEAQVPFMLPEKEGLARAQTMPLAHADAKAPSSAVADDPRPDDGWAASLNSLEAEWQAHDKLQVRHPWIQAPARWRAYQDRLLRFEQLRRRGYDSPTLRSQLLADSKVLEDCLRYPSASLPYALPMPGVLGKGIPADKRHDMGEKLDKLWGQLPAPEASAAKSKEAIDSLRKDLADTPRRVAMAGMLLAKAEQSRKDFGGFRTAEMLLPELGLQGNQRPAELHLMAMLWRDLVHEPKQPPRLPERDFARALETRQLAEEAALAAGDADSESGYAELILPWTRERVEEADAKRRAGEDQLLLSNEAGWSEARQKLEEARRTYREVRADAVILRRALKWYAQAMAELPYYSPWLASAPTSLTDETLLNTAEELWSQTHELGAALASHDRTKLSRIKDLADKVGGSLPTIEQRFLDNYQKLIDTPAENQTQWKWIERALTVPFIPWEKRLRLIKQSHDITQTLEGTGESGSAPTESDAAEAANGAFKRARWQARLALASLSRSILESGATGDTNLVNRVRNATNWGPLEEAGALVYAQTWRVPDQLRELAGAMHKAESPSQVADTLARADQLSRQIDGAAVADEELAGVLEEGRRLQLAALLSWQAQRAYLDFWAGENPDRPYYLEAAQAYLRDARDVLEKANQSAEPPVRRKRQANIDQLEQILTRRPKLQLDKPAHLDALTGQPSLKVSYVVRADADVPPGTPVIWLDPKDFKPFDASKPLTQRQPLGLLSSKADRREEVPYALKNAFRQEKAQVVGELLYRGHKQEKSIELDSYPDPDVIVHREEPEAKAAIAARATNEFQTEAGLAIVLDWSGSMDEPLRDNKDRKKVDAAREALSRVLPIIPRGTTVSVWIFARRQGPEEKDPARPGAYVASVKHTAIEQILPKTAWDPGALTNPVRQVMDEVEKRSTPCNYTPLAEAIVRAAEDIKDIRGIKTVVVLTDGADTCFSSKDNPDYHTDHPDFVRRYRPDNYRDIPEFLKDKFGPNSELKDIALKMIFFGVPEREKKDAQAQFPASLIQSLPTPGTVVSEDDEARLVNELRLALRPKLRVLDNLKGERPPQIPEKGLDITLTEEAAQEPFWSPALDTNLLGARGYRVRVGKMPEQRVSLRPGERLLLDVTPDRFQRGLWTQRYLDRQKVQEKERYVREDGGWKLAVLQNRHRRYEGLELLLAAEDTQHRATTEPDDFLEQHWPTFLFAELRPKGQQGPAPRLWLGEAAKYPSPAWRLQSPWSMREDGSGLPAEPVLRVWRCDRLPDLEEERSHPPGRSLEKFQETIRDVRLDAWLAPAETVHPKDLFSKRSEPCLVIHASYPKDRPVFVQVEIEGRKIHNYEHRLYRPADQYIGCFWPVTESMIREKGFSVRIIPLHQAMRETPPVVFDLPVPDDRVGPATVER